MANPIITNVGLVSRNEQLAVASKVVLDGADIAADGIMLRGSLLTKKANGKWRQALSSDALTLNEIRLLVDDVKVEAAKDAFGAGYVEGFFRLSHILAMQPVSASITAAVVTGAPGFYLVEADEVRLK